MKKMILAAGLMPMGLFATDFSQMTMEQLNAMRGSVPSQERDAFRAEMQKRLKAMNQEERKAYIKARKQNASGMGNGSGQKKMQRLRDGSGDGMMHRGGKH